MARKKQIKELNIKMRSGIVLMFLSCIIFIITITGGFVWSSNIDFGSRKIYVNNNDINGENLNATIENLNSIDADTIFKNLYNKSLEVLTSGIAYNTSWIDICPSSQKIINGEIYIKVCDARYSNVNDIIEELKEYFSISYINSLISDNYIDYLGELYIKPFQNQMREDYAGINKYNILYKTTNKIIFEVESKYGAFECFGECNYNYATHKFVVSKENNKWVVSEFELPQ